MTECPNIFGAPYISELWRLQNNARERAYLALVDVAESTTSLTFVGNSGLLIFDGDCGFCTTSAHWIESHWSKNAATAESWQKLGADRLSELGLTHDDVTTKAWWSDDRGVRGGERAVAAALIAAGGLWKFVGLVLDTPPIRWLAKPGYRLVARYRYKLPGATEACRIGS